MKISKLALKARETINFKVLLFYKNTIKWLEKLSINARQS